MREPDLNFARQYSRRTKAQINIVFIMEGVKVDIDTQQKFQILEMIIDKQSKELTRLSNAIERISAAMTAVRMNESKGKKR